MHYSENYKGFDIVQREIPGSINMWTPELIPGNDEQRAQLEIYWKKHGAFATPVGPKDQAFEAARRYIDEVLQEKLPDAE